MRAQRGGDTTIHRPPTPKAANATGTYSQASPDIFAPHVLGAPVEYYFYPNSAIPVFCPTREQFADFEALVAAIEPLALRGGVCKIIPPRSWRAELERRRERVLNEEEFPIMKPIVQHFNGSSGIFHQYNVEFHRKLKLAQFFHMSQDSSHRRPEVKVAMAEPNDDDDNDNLKSDDDVKPDNRTIQSDVAGVCVDYALGEVRLTSSAASALHSGIRSESQRAQFAPAVARFRPHPDISGETAGVDHLGAQQPRRFTSDDGRALFVSARELAENEELERVYWKNMLFQPPMYGADVLGTLFPPYEEFPTWNIRNLPGLLRHIGQRMPGVNDPYLYLGMWKATFAWHVEDMDLYSINYIHFGEPKAWYAIPIDAHSRFEMCMQNVFANDYKSCPQFLRHKAFLLSPRFLAAQSIPYNRVVQRAGEIILTFPKGYHAGFNHGFNCAESVNFALDRWLDIAWNSRHCECTKDSVTIDLMEWFGDSRKDRPAQDRVSPRRHAAAAVALSGAGSPSRDGKTAKLGRSRKSAGSADVAGQGTKRGTLQGAKRRPSQAPKPEPGPKRSPQKSATRDQVEITNQDEICDPTLQFASLFTPVGTCGACLLPVSQTDTGGMVECQQCGLTVHALCSALEVDDGNYRCANCEMDTDQLSCALCPFQNGLLLPVKHEGVEDRGPEFVHFLCANFISETYFDGPADLPTPTSPAQAEDRVSTRSRTAAQASQTLGVMRSSAKVCGVQSISKSRFAGKCMYCSDTQCVGAVVQCSHAKCFRLFHPMCAAVCSRGLLDWSQYKAYCASHRGDSKIF
ncbi:hypothetical protein IWW56_001218 [Coemansia sp. RSA 2131]|nr:hypothetical protein IWW56_001218 [Coemansia sp. RSA 2131]